MAKSRFKNKFSIVDILVMLLFIAIIGFTIFMIQYSNNYINRYVEIIQDNIQSRLFTESRVIQGLFSETDLNNFRTEADMKSEDYINLRKELNNYAEKQDLESIYILRIHSGQIQYIVDSDLNLLTQRGLGNFTDPNQLIRAVYDQRRAIVSKIGDYTTGKDGILSAYSPVFDMYGNVIAVIVIDISDAEIVKRQSEVENITIVSVASVLFLAVGSLLVTIRYRKKAAEQFKASKTKSEFLSKMSHEMRTPMNAIIGFCRMIKESKDPVKKESYIGNILSSSDYLLELINAVLDVSKIEANKMILDLEVDSVHELIKSTERMMSPQSEAKNQTFTIHVDENIPELLKFDRTRLSQVIINLTSNAVKFTPEGGEVTLSANLVRLLDTSCNIEFTITDTGIGIPKETMNKLFEPFEQADSSITRSYGGTGLGLTIAKHLSEMMKGTISATSTEGEGSTFRFNAWLDIPSQREIDEKFALPEEKPKEVIDPTPKEEVIDPPKVEEEVIEPKIEEPPVVDEKEETLVEKQPVEEPQVEETPKEVTSDSIMNVINELQIKEPVIEETTPEPEIKEPEPVEEKEEITPVDENPVPVEDSKPEREVDCTGMNFLVAEDNNINQIVIKDLLESYGAETEFAFNGQEAVEMFEANPEKYDMIFMDIQMPVMDGVDAADKIRKSNAPNAKTIPIFAVTAEVFEEDRERIMDAGMNKHLGKPLNTGQFTVAIKEAMNI